MIHQTLQRLASGLALVLLLALPYSITAAQERRIIPEPGLAKEFGTLIAMNSAFVAVLTRQWTDPFPPSRLQVYRRDDALVPVLDRLVPTVYVHQLVMSEDVLAVGIENEFILYRRIGTRWYPGQSLSGDHVAVDGSSVVIATCDHKVEAPGCRIRTYSVFGAAPVLENEFSRPDVLALALAGGTLYVSEVESDSDTGVQTKQIRSYTRAAKDQWEPLGVVRPGTDPASYKSLRFDYGSSLVASPNTLVIESAFCSAYDGTGSCVILDVTNKPRAKTGTSQTFMYSSTDPEFLLRFEDEQSKAVIAGSRIVVLRNDGSLDHFLLTGKAAPAKKPSIAARLKQQGRRAVAIAGTSNGIAIVVEKSDRAEREVWIAPP